MKDGRGLRRRFAVDHCKLGENCLGEELLMVAMHRRNSNNARQSIGALAVVGTIMELPHGAALAETIAREARLPPERIFVIKYFPSVHTSYDHMTKGTGSINTGVTQQNRDDLVKSPISALCFISCSLRRT